MAKSKVVKVEQLKDQSYKNDYGEFDKWAVAFEDKVFGVVTVKKGSAAPFPLNQEAEYEVVEGKVGGKINGADALKVKKPTKPYNGGGGAAPDPNKSHNIVVTTCIQETTRFIMGRHDMTIETHFEKIFNFILKVGLDNIK
jgi:hypothetical protein